MRTIATVAVLAFALPSFGQGNMQLTAAVAKKAPGEWTVSGTCTNAGPSFGTMVYVRYYGTPVGNTGLRVGSIWSGTFVRPDGSWAVTFKTSEANFPLEVYTFTESVADRRPPARISVLVP